MFKKLFTQEEGFTLVELLVTIAIVSILFGITTLTLSGVSTKAKTDMCANEVYVVQSAIDIWNAANPSSAIAANDVTAATVGPGSPATFGTYLKTTSAGLYLWDAGGVNLAQNSCP